MSSATPCKFFFGSSGYCKYANDCKFSHQQSSVSNSMIHAGANVGAYHGHSYPSYSNYHPATSSVPPVSTSASTFHSTTTNNSLSEEQYYQLYLDRQAEHEDTSFQEQDMDVESEDEEDEETEYENEDNDTNNINTINSSNYNSYPEPGQPLSIDQMPRCTVIGCNLIAISTSVDGKCPYCVHLEKELGRRFIKKKFSPCKNYPSCKRNAGPHRFCGYCHHTQKAQQYANTLRTKD
ncbi:MAG: hypothetical protein Sylvanvirus1_59 [Sylvanvirus sp.]|uniref:C3H1-type domain-containing protein n=1 Tax=Sylvanvirus sp. TaxID=2487774 RepID=A0A3G5AK14_9VIRU|nr:MAG: hypothetical protein Sylvanvirus1_59 [Sylvanvirus sp.]